MVSGLARRAIGSKRRFAGFLLAALTCAAGSGPGHATQPQPPASAALLGAQQTDVARSFKAAGDAAVTTLEREFYRSAGRWNACVPGDCGTLVRDWGADALAYALFFRWRVTRDSSVVPIMDALVESLPTYGTCALPACSLWSDVPLWDAIAAARAYEVTGEPIALDKAERAFAFVDASDAFALGNCPAIDFQQPRGGGNALKTLETDSNYIRAALVLDRLTGDERYLRRARAKYAAARRYFLDPHVALYSVYVFDGGAACTQVPRRFFASVNGNMIESGLLLAARTGDRRYRREALATARAVTRYLSDSSGIYADLQADNDVAQPLIEAMYDVATQAHQAFARRWLLDAAAVAQPATSGAYGRFFDGPPPDGGPVSAWSSAGGLTLAIAAAALDPAGRTDRTDAWARAHFVADPIASTPAQIDFTGQAIALIGTIGEVCCEAGHVRVFIDGTETFDQTGIWQNKSPASHALPGSVLLSWRWPHSGHHTITLEPGVSNPKEGGSFIHLAGYELVP